MSDQKYIEFVTELQNSDAEVRAQACVELGKIKDNRSIELLIGALNDRHEYVGKYAAQSLGDVGDATAISALMVASENTKRALVCFESRDAITKIKKRVEGIQSNYEFAKSTNPSFQSQTSTIQMDSIGEIIMIKAILDKTLNATTCISAIKGFGFKYIEESFMGQILESEYGRILLNVKVSIHPTNLATLLYLEKKTEKETYLVEDGLRC